MDVLLDIEKPIFCNIILYKVYVRISLLIRDGLGITLSGIWCLTPHTKNVPAPCKVEKSIIVVPSQTWYFTEASNWTPSIRNLAKALKIGSSSCARHASASKPNLVDTFKTLYCHLKYSSSITKVGASIYFHFNRIL